MKQRLILAVVALSIALLTFIGENAWAGEKIKIAVVTGGHDFAEKPFLSLFQGYDDIEFTHIVLKDDSEIFEDIGQWPYDVLVLYNLTQKISEKRQQNFLKLLDKGVGVVVLHHAIASYSDWPEYRKIIGVKYYLKETVEDGVKHPACTYQHGLDMPIHIEDKGHPITQGLADFKANDETYKGSSFEPDNHVLLTSDHPSNDKAVAWTRTCRKANVCFIQLGHGDAIFADGNYRKLVVQAIRWTTSGRK